MSGQQPLPRETRLLQKVNWKTFGHPWATTSWMCRKSNLMCYSQAYSMHRHKQIHCVIFTSTQTRHTFTKYFAQMPPFSNTVNPWPPAHSTNLGPIPPPSSRRTSRLYRNRLRAALGGCHDDIANPHGCMARNAICNQNFLYPQAISPSPFSAKDTATSVRS